MTEKEKQQFINAKNKSWLVAKIVIRKKKDKVWNLTEHQRISNQLKKYEKEDIDTLSKLYEYLVEVNEISSDASIFKLIKEANEFMQEKVPKKKMVQIQPPDLMKYL